MTTQRRIDFKNQMLKKDTNIVGAIHESPLKHDFEEKNGVFVICCRLEKLLKR